MLLVSNLYFIIFAAMLTWKVTEAFETYYKYPIDTKIAFYYSPLLDFPAVTMCNINSLKWSSLALISGQDSGNTMKEYLQVSLGSLMY
jgi:hypothetical protein